MSGQGELNEAIRLYKSGQHEASRQLLRNELLRDSDMVSTLLWLAKVSPDEREAAAAAELALALEPANEIAQRGVIAVHQRFQANGSVAPALDVMRITGLTRAQARSVNWPFRGLNRPMGVLLDEGVIGLNDLGFAIQKAFDAQVKKAATTLLLAHLLGEGLKDPLPPLTVVESGSHAARRERISILFGGMTAGVSALFLLVFVGFGAVSLYMGLTNSQLARPFALIQAAFVLGALFFAPALSWMMDRFADEAENSRKGAEGEIQLADALRASLHSPWTLFRNVEWPARKWGDVDAVLVGPGGVWALEVKAYTREVRTIGEKWEYKTRWGWRKMRLTPGKQAQRNAMNVKDYLDLHGVRLTWVNAVVVWAGDESKLTVEDPAVPVWTLSNLPEHLDALWQSEKLSEEQIEKSVAILSEVIEKDKVRGVAKK